MKLRDLARAYSVLEGSGGLFMLYASHNFFSPFNSEFLFVSITGSLFTLYAITDFIHETHHYAIARGIYNLTGWQEYKEESERCIRISLLDVNV